MNYALCALVSLLLTGCGASIVSQATFPTAQIAVAPSATLGLVRPPTATPPALTPTSVSTPSPLPPTEALVAQEQTSGPEQLRRWMEEARTAHPYNEELDTMWAVMMCESGGDPGVVGAGIYHGLFQYSLDTWSGDWNPYRDRSIFDPQAQIFATAKAWQDGHQGWWGCYGR